VLESEHNPPIITLTFQLPAVALFCTLGSGPRACSTPSFDQIYVYPTPVLAVRVTPFSPAQYLLSGVAVIVGTGIVVLLMVKVFVSVKAQHNCFPVLPGSA